MTVSEQAADTMRGQIMNRQMVPGQVVNEEASARIFGISRPSVRQALATLEAEGLLTRHATTRMLQVTSLTADDIAAIYRARRVLEYAGVEAAGEVAEERLDVLRQALARIEHSVLADDALLQVEADYAMHEAIVSFLDAPDLSALLTQLLTRLRLAVATDSLKNPRPDAMLQDNRFLCQLLTRRQVGEARAVLARRLDAAERSIIGCLDLPKTPVEHLS